MYGWISLSRPTPTVRVIQESPSCASWGDLFVFGVCQVDIEIQAGTKSENFLNMILDGLSTLAQYPSPPCNRIFEVAIACVGIDAFIDTRIAFALTGQGVFHLLAHRKIYRYTTLWSAFTIRRTWFVPWSICGSHSLFAANWQLFSMFLHIFATNLLCVLYSCVLAGYCSHHRLNHPFKSFNGFSSRGYAIIAIPPIAWSNHARQHIQAHRFWLIFLETLTEIAHEIPTKYVRYTFCHRNNPSHAVRTCTWPIFTPLRGRVRPHQGYKVSDV